jgi:hypothetical protein
MQTGRVLNGSRAFALLLDLKQEDRFYTCLPLYHGEPVAIEVPSLVAIMKLTHPFC